MATYDCHEIRYRGRHIRVDLRLGCATGVTLSGCEVIHGKKLEITDRDEARILKLCWRDRDLRSRVEAYYEG